MNIQIFKSSTILRILAIVVVGLIASFVWRLFLRRLRTKFEGEDVKRASELERRTKTLIRGFQIIGNIIIITVITVIVLKEIGIEIGPIIATMGIVGFAVGFGAQSLIKDFLAGFFLILEDQLRIGDIVAIGAAIGKVEKITIKSTRIRGKDGELYIIPNGGIRQIINYSRRISQLVIEITAEEKPDALFNFVTELASKIYKDELKRILVEPVKVSGIKGYEKGRVTIRMIFTSRLRERNRIASLVIPKVSQQFNQKGIKAEITFQTPEGFTIT